MTCSLALNSRSRFNLEVGFRGSQSYEKTGIVVFEAAPRQANRVKTAPNGTKCHTNQNAKNAPRA